MATVTASYNWVSGETVTPTKLNTAAAPTVVVADNEVTTAKILDDAVTNAKLATGIDASKITTGTLPIARIADAAVTQAKLASGVATSGPAFRAYANSTTSVASGVETKVTLGAEDFDTANCFASSRFTPNVAGYYWISAAMRCENLLAANVALYKNGARHSWGTNANAGTYHSHVSDLIYLNGTTDYVELYAYQGSAGTQNVGTQLFSPVSAYTWMSGFLARAA
jgi:hypothetical protein